MWSRVCFSMLHRLQTEMIFSMTIMVKGTFGRDYVMYHFALEHYWYFDFFVILIMISRNKRTNWFLLFLFLDKDNKRADHVFLHRLFIEN